MKDARCAVMLLGNPEQTKKMAKMVRYRGTNAWTPTRTHPHTDTKNYCRWRGGPRAHPPPGVVPCQAEGGRRAQDRGVVDLDAGRGLRGH